MARRAPRRRVGEGPEVHVDAEGTTIIRGEVDEDADTSAQEPQGPQAATGGERVDPTQVPPAQETGGQAPRREQSSGPHHPRSDHPEGWCLWMDEGEQRREQVRQAFEHRPTLTPAEQKANVVEMREQLRMAELDFRDNIAAAHELNRRTSAKQQRRYLSQESRMLAEKKFLDVRDAMAKGTDTDAMVEAMTTALVLLVIDKDFRTFVGGEYGRVFERLSSENLQNSADKMFARRDARQEQRNQRKRETWDQENRDRERMGLPPLPPLKLKEGPGNFEQKLREKNQAWKRDGRSPFDKNTAGLMQVGLMMHAYNELREPGIDEKGKAEVHANLAAQLEQLDLWCQADGLSREDVDEAARVNVGRLLGEDPSMARMFAETSYGDVRRSGEKTEVLPDGTTRTSWDGSFAWAHTGEPANGGSFTLRDPGDTLDHLDVMGNALQAMTARCATGGQVQDLITAMAISEDFSWHQQANTLSPAVREKAQVFDTIRAAQRDDSISPAATELVMGAAMSQAMSLLKENNPQVYADWHMNHADSWQVDYINKLGATDPATERLYAQRMATKIREQTGGGRRDHDAPTTSDQPSSHHVDGPELEM